MTEKQAKQTVDTNNEHYNPPRWIAVHIPKES
jgi:hypothetical protein